MLTQVPELLLGYTLQSSLLLTGGLLMWALLNRTSAATRHLVLALTVIGCSLLPLGKGFQVSLPVLPVLSLPSPLVQNSQSASPLPRTDSPAHTVRVPTAALSTQAPANLAVRPSTGKSPFSLSRQFSLPWRAIWWFGFISIGASLVLSALRLHRLRHSTRLVQLPDSVRESILPLLKRRAFPEVRQSADVRIPIITGTVHPVIFLPVNWDTWSESCLSSVIRHETAHLVRGDLLLQHVTNFSLALYWFNPLIWLAAHLLGKEREKACHDLVLASGTRASVYAESLLEVLQKFQCAGRGRRWLPSTAIGMATQSKITQRIQAILSNSVDRSLPNRRVVACTVTLISTLILALGVVRVAHAAPKFTGSLDKLQEKGEQPRPSKKADPEDKVAWLTLKVLDESGKPVPDASIEQSSISYGFTCYPFTASGGQFPSQMVQTDPNGEAKVRYPAMHAGQKPSTIRVEISHPNFCKNLFLVDCENPKPVTLVHGARLTLHGKVHDSKDPVPEIFAQVADQEEVCSSFPRQFGSVSGRLPSASYLVRAVALDKEGIPLFSNPVSVALASGVDKVLDLELYRGTDFHGKLSANVPRPVTSGTVVAEVRTPNPDTSDAPLLWKTCAPVEPDGSFHLTNLPQGEVWAIGYCDGFVSSNADPDLDSPGFVKAQQLSAQGELLMEKTGTAEILVLSPEGKPVANAQVRFWPNQLFDRGSSDLRNDSSSAEELQQELKKLAPRQGTPDSYMAVTNLDGIARVSGLPAGHNNFGIAANHLQVPADANYGGDIARTQIRPGEITKQTVRMELIPGSLADGKPDPEAKTIEFSGIVYGANNSPLPAVQVVLHELDTNKVLLSMRTDTGGKYGGKVTGHFKEGRPIADATIIPGSPDTAIQECKIRPGANASKLEPAIPVGGKVIDPKGKPITSLSLKVLTVALRNGHKIDLNQTWRVKGGNGDFQIGNLPAGAKATVEISGPGYTLIHQTVTPAEPFSFLQIELHPASP